MKNKKTIGIVVLGALTTIGFAISTIGFSQSSNYLFNTTATDPYKLVLDSHNAVSSAGTYTMTSTTGGQVKFTYTNVSSSSGNHTAITAGGSIVNYDIIHSISNFKAEFEGTLQARIAYSTNTWGEYFDLVSGQTLSLGTNPYYLEMKATTNVVLKSATYFYSCLVNSNAEAQSVNGSYDIVFKENATDNASECSSISVLDQVTAGVDYIESVESINKVYAGSAGLKFGSSKAIGGMDIKFDASEVSQNITSIDFSVAQYGSDSGKLDIVVNDDNNLSTQITPSSGSGSIAVNEKVTSIDISTSSKRAYLKGITLNYGGSSEPSAPVDVVGFTASDSKKNSYNTNSIYDNDNGLDVEIMYSDGTHTSIPHGGEKGYSYVVKDSSDQVIDTSKTFDNEGSYTAVISYKDYIPVEIPFTVGEYIYITDITASMDVITFNTSDVFANSVATNLTALVSYSDGATQNLSYNSFVSNGIGVKLLTPRGIAYTQTSPFGSEGEWTVRVYDLTDENICNDIKITVNAILVQAITLNHSSYEMYPDDTLQLETTINPTNATNSLVVWESSNTDAVTVDQSGLVTAVAIGGGTITATAADGSGIVASCAITVVAKPADPYIITFSKESSDSGIALTTASYSSYISSGSSYISSVSGITRVYPGKNGYKFGSGSGGGDITFNLSSQVKSSTISTIEFSTVAYNGTDNESMSVYINGGSANTFNSSSGNTVTVNGTVNTIRVTSFARAYLSGITLNQGSGSPLTPTYPDSITVSGTSPISIGDTTQLTVNYSPNTTNVQNVTYSSSNTAVATVSATGLVTGVSAGTAVITATAEAANSTTVSNTISIKVNAISVTSVSLNASSASIKAGKTTTLVPTILPSNATNKSVNWSTSNSSVATVSGGLVTGVAAGTATITATTVDGNKTATCVVTVTASSSASAWQLVDSASSLQAGDVIVLASNVNGETNGDLSSQILSSVSSTFSSNKEEIEELNENTVQFTLGGSEGAWTLANESGQLLGATAVKKLAWNSGTTTWSISISGGDATITNTNSSYGKILYNKSSPRFTTYTSAATDSMPLPQIYRGGTAEPTDPTSIILSSANVELSPNGSKTLSVSYVPSNANQNKQITWTSSNTSVATVNSDGKITVAGSATAGQTATITATLTNLPSIHASCTVTVVEQAKADQTILIYICGADLESTSSYRLATGDITEMLSVSGQPDDVNIVIETGGAKSWASTYGISSTYLQRHHVSNKSLITDDSLTYASMGVASTLQSFIEYGINNYPANRTGLILWNHGGAMRGVCYDEKKSDDSLLTNEVVTAVKNAKTNTGHSENLEWIGYDACLMQVQDIAEQNSHYFNYMVASEESEAGEGWDYDTWVDDLYAKKTTPTILKAVVDGFIKDNGGTSSSSNDQTLSYLNLSYAAQYLEAWEDMAGAIKITSSNKSSFATLVKSAKYYADDSYTYYGIFDAKDFVNKLANNSTFNPGSTYTNAVLTAHSNLVAYSSCGKGAGNSYGLCMFWSINSNCSKSTYYTSSMTNFSTWRSLVVTHGS